MDPRLRIAVDASVGWYEDLCALHGVGSIMVDGLWSALDTPPPLHSDAVVVEPDVPAGRVLARLDGRDRCGVKDSFATMDLAGEGMELLFSATWIHREPAPDRRPGAPAGWVPVTGAHELSDWTGRHDTRDVLLPPLLRRAHFRILARYVDGHIVAGAVARLGSGAVDVSNVYAVPGHRVDWAELVEVSVCSSRAGSLSDMNAATPSRTLWKAVSHPSVSCGSGSARRFVRAAAAGSGGTSVVRLAW